MPTKVRSAPSPALWAQSPELEPGETNPRSEEQEWHKDIEWLIKGHPSIHQAKNQNLQVLCFAVFSYFLAWLFFFFSGFTQQTMLCHRCVLLCSAPRSPFALESCKKCVVSSALLPKPGLFKPNKHKSPPEMRSGLWKCYLKVGLCRVVTGENPKSSPHPKPGLQDSGAATPNVSLRLQGTYSFYLDAKPHPKTSWT